MKIYIKFLTSIFFKSFFYVSLIMFSLVFILNMLTELEFFKEIDVGINFTLLLSLLNSPSMIFEMFPFIFLITTQLFFIKLFNNNELEVFKYSGLKNSNILGIISALSLIAGVLIIFTFYNFSANLKNFYLEKKSQYTSDEKYLAVITKNGLWIKDLVDEKVKIINASKIDENYLIDVFISEFDDNYNLKRSIVSNKVDIKDYQWTLYNPKVLENDTSVSLKEITLYSNFNYQRIQNLYSNLSSFSLLELLKLKDNYKKLNYSTTEVDMQLQKLFSFPIYLTLMTILSALIMFNIKNFNSATFKILFGLFLSVLIYYLNNFLYVMGNTEKISLLISIWMPMILLMFTNLVMIIKINDK